MSRATIWGACIFFVLGFILYLGNVYQHKHGTASGANALPTIVAPAAVTPPPAAPVTTVPVEAAKKP